MKSFLNEFAQQLKEQWCGQLQNIAVVVNNKRPISFLQHHLTEGIKEPIWSPQFFTIDEWVSLIDKSHRIDEVDEFFILYDLYNELLAEEGITSISQDEFLSFSDIIRQDFAQIMNYLVSSEELFKYLEDVAQLELDFPTLTEEQRNYLGQFWSAIEHESPLEAQQRFIKLWVRVGQLMKRYEQQLIMHEKTTLAFSFKRIAQNTEYFLNELPFQHIYFLGFNAIHPALQVMVDTLEAKHKITLVYDWDAYYVDNKLNKAGLFFRQQEKDFDQPLPQNFKQPKEIHVYGMEGNIAQAKYLHQLLPSLVNDKNIGLEEIGVVLSDETLAIPVLQSIPEMPYNLSMGYPLQFGNIYRWLDWILSLQEYYHQQSLVRVSKDIVLMGTALMQEESSLFKELWLKLTKQSINAPYIKVNDLEVFGEQLLLPIKDSTTLLSMLRSFVKSRLEKLNVEEEYQKLEINLMLYAFKTLETFYYNIIQHHQSIDTTVLIRLLRKKLQQLNVPLSGYNLEAIQVLGLLESRALDFKKVVLLSANEGILPSLSQRPSLIPDNIRRAFKLPVLEHQDALVAHVFYSLLQRAEEIHVLYDQTISNQSTGEITRFIKQIDFESEHEIHYHNQEQSIVPGPKIPSLIIEKTPEVLAKIQNIYLNGEKSFSASALNSYLNCSLGFYMRYIAGYKEEDEVAKFDARKIGTIIHNVLEDCYKGYKDQIVDKDVIKGIEKDLTKLVEKKVLEELYLEEFNAEATIIKELSEHAVKTFLKVDKLYNPFKIIDIENDQKSEGAHITSIIINDSNGMEHEVYLRIIVDRIDEYQGAIRLIDYKTGTIKQLNVSSIEELFSKEKRDSYVAAVFQLMLYSWVYYKNTQTTQLIIPQVWSSRFLSTTQDNVYITIGKTKIQPGMDPDVWHKLLAEFEVHLKELLEEIIFNDEILIKHNEENKKSYCGTNEYAVFCLGQ